MPLTDEDLAAIGRLMDQKLAVTEDRQRRRRRFWTWFWIGLFVVGSLASWWLLDRLIARAQDEMARITVEFSESKLAYQRALERSERARQDRRQAEHAVHYDPAQTQAEHEAGLIAGMVSLLAAKDRFMHTYDQADLSDPEVMQSYAQDLNRIIEQGLTPLGQIVLRNTDPVHNTRDERMRGDGAATPIDAPARAPDPAPAIRP